MAQFDYLASAELYPGRRYGLRTLSYRRFDTAAAALQFAIEQMPAELLAGATLEIGEERFQPDDIRRLYDSNDYPLPRGTARR